MRLKSNVINLQNNITTRPPEYETCTFDVNTWFRCGKYDINFKVQLANV
jgi:hypothetical protein